MPKDIFEERAVLPDVKAGRGYTSYQAGDQAAVVGVAPELGLPERAGWLQKALVCGGWVIPKCATMPDHPVFGTRPESQLRPDEPVMRRWVGHDHGGMLHRHRDDPKLQRRRGKNRGRCYCGVIHTSPPIRRVLQWEGGAGKHALVPERPPRQEWSWYQPPMKAKLRRMHEAKACDVVTHPDGTRELVPTGHRAPKAGEYLLPSGERRHCAAGEVVVPIDRPHAHLKWAKYLYTKGNSAKRVSTHPHVRDAGFATQEGLFAYAIEGTLKLDSVVSAGWPGIETGSVTLWDVLDDETDVDVDLDDDGAIVGGGVVEHHELEEFAARHLVGVPTAIICDSDWAENHLVRDQVNAAVALLANVGVPAVGCAPGPGQNLGWTHPVTGHAMQAKQGVDDYLAGLDRSARHDGLLDLVVREPSLEDAPGLEAAVERATNAKGAAGFGALLRELGRDAGADGVTPYRRKSLAGRTGRAERNVDKARDRFVERGDLTPVAEAEHYLRGGRFGTKPPLYQLRPELVPPTRTRTLREWLETL